MLLWLPTLSASPYAAEPVWRIARVFFFVRNGWHWASIIGFGFMGVETRFVRYSVWFHDRRHVLRMMSVNPILLRTLY